MVDYLWLSVYLIISLNSSLTTVSDTHMFLQSSSLASDMVQVWAKEHKLQKVADTELRAEKVPHSSRRIWGKALNTSPLFCLHKVKGVGDVGNDRQENMRKDEGLCGEKRFLLSPPRLGAYSRGYEMPSDIKYILATCIILFSPALLNYQTLLL